MKRTDIHLRDPFVLVADGPFMYRAADGTLQMLWASFSGEGDTQGLAVSDNGENTGRFAQAEPLFRRDGGHGMIFRRLDGQLMMTLHSSNNHPKVRPFFFEAEETDGLLRRKQGGIPWRLPVQGSFPSTTGSH